MHLHGSFAQSMQEKMLVLMPNVSPQRTSSWDRQRFKEGDLRWVHAVGSHHKEL